jgi:hypothetical protein
VRRNRQDAGNRQGRQERRSPAKISSLGGPGVLLRSWRFLLASMTVQGLGVK